MDDVAMELHERVKRIVAHGKEAKASNDRAVGALENLQRQLKDDFKVNTISLAKKKLEELIKEEEELEGMLVTSLDEAEAIMNIGEEK